MVVTLQNSESDLPLLNCVFLGSFGDTVFVCFFQLVARNFIFYNLLESVLRIAIFLNEEVKEI